VPESTYTENKKKNQSTICGKLIFEDVVIPTVGDPLANDNTPGPAILIFNSSTTIFPLSLSTLLSLSPISKLLLLTPLALLGDENAAFLPSFVAGVIALPGPDNNPILGLTADVDTDNICD